MTDDELIAYLYGEGNRFMREVPDNGICGLYTMIFTTALVVDMDVSGYSHRFCFKEPQDALVALKSWTGEGEP